MKSYRSKRGFGDKCFRYHIYAFIFMSVIHSNFSYAVDWCVPEEDYSEVAIFGNAKIFGTTTLTNTCKSSNWEPECSDCIGSDLQSSPESIHAEVPPYWGSEPSLIWGNQGAFVVVNGCDEDPIPAIATVTYPRTNFSPDYNNSWSYTCPAGVGVDERTYSGDFTGMAWDIHYLKAVFDPNVFRVNGSSISPCWAVANGKIHVTLVNDDCETLKKALKAQVTIYHQKEQWAMEYASCGLLNDVCPIPMIISELTKEAQIGEAVKVKFVPGDLLESKCGSPDGPAQQPETEKDASVSGSCSSCSGGGSGTGGLGSFSVGNASAGIGFGEEGTLSIYGAPGFTYDTAGNVTGALGVPEINAPGAWLRAEHYPYQKSDVAYTTQESGDAITSIHYAFNVLTHGHKTNHYELNLTGNWGDEYNTPDDPDSGIKKNKDQVALEAFYEASKGKVPLTHVTDPDGITILEFDSSGEDLIQISKDANGTVNGYIVYDMENSTLKRVWSGKDLSQYDERSVGTPAGGRWVDVDYNVSSSDGKKYLEDVTYGGCSSCRAPRSYEYGGPKGNQITKIKKADGTVLASYTYDAQGRFQSYTNGNGAAEKKVNEWQHSDYDPADPNTSGDNMLVRRDYVSNTLFRAKVFFADDNGALTKEIHYHQLQDDTDRLEGPYSVYKYYHINDETEGVGYVTEYPKGNKRVKYYDENDNVVKVLWEHDALHPEVEYAYQTITYDDDTRDLVQYETNSYGGITTYTYEGFNIKTQTEPAPTEGISGSGQQIIGYEYDYLDRVDYEYKKDSTGASVYTKYVYDGDGNIKRIHENCTDYDQENPVTGLVTTYEYNDYNEQIKTTYPSGKVERKFYSDAGTVIAEAVYEDDENDSAVSATIYEYEDGKLRYKKTAKMNEPFTFTESIVLAGGEGVGITWIQETYDYDVYGRKEAVIADSGTGGQSLRTEYEYNNQGEMTRVLQPDKRYKRITRDGRGLVTEETTGILIGSTENPKATTKYFYDLNGNLIRKVDPEGVTEIYQYDAKDRRVRVRHGK